MQVGIQLPQWGPTADRAGILTIARAAEEAGFDSVWASDHVVYPLEGEADYPYGSTGPPFSPDDGYLEILTTLAVVAGATTRIGLGTSVLVLPMRNLLLTAKMLSTLDVLSEGRVVLALAAGWWQAEFDAMGADFGHRGTTLDEQIEALRGLWSKGEYAMQGQQVRFPLVASKPLPVRQGGPEIWVGGTGARTWARVAQEGVTGWHGIGYTAEGVNAAREGIEKACRVSGRDPATVRFSTATGFPNTRAKFADRLESLRSLGISQVVFIPRVSDVAGVLAQIDVYGTEVRPGLD